MASGLTFGSGGAGLSFGTTTAQSSFGGFGTSTATTTTAAAGGFGFGTPAATTASAFGTAQPNVSLTTSAPATAPTQPSLFGQSSGFSFGTQQPQTTQSSFSFGLSTTTTAAPSTTGLASSTPGFFSSTPSLFSKPTFGTTSAPSTTSLLGQKPATTAPSLGGNLGGEVAPPNLNKAVKDGQIPTELSQLIQNFKEVLKQQKNDHSEISRASIKPLQKTAEDFEGVRHLLVKLERAVNINKNAIVKLKNDTIRCHNDCEMAQRTMELAPGSQAENIAPIDYFSQLAERFQEQVVMLRLEIENTEKHIHSALNPAALSPQELNNSMLRLHQCFVALAGRLQMVHTEMSRLKQNHLDVRRKKTNDFVDIFDRKLPAAKEIPELTTCGSTLTANNLYHSVAALIQNKNPDKSALGVGTQQQTTLANFSLFQPNQTLMSPFSSDAQLKTPPGTKRGKR